MSYTSEASQWRYHALNILPGLASLLSVPYIFFLLQGADWCCCCYLDRSLECLSNPAVWDQASLMCPVLLLYGLKVYVRQTKAFEAEVWYLFWCFPSRHLQHKVYQSCAVVSCYQWCGAKKKNKKKKENFVCTHRVKKVTADGLYGSFIILQNVIT